MSKLRKCAFPITVAGVALLTMVSAGAADAGMKPGTDSVAKISSRGQKITSGIAGQDNTDDRHCRGNATWNAIVYWNLGKVTKSSIHVKSIKVRYSNGRRIHVGSVRLVDDNSQRWIKGWGWFVPKGGGHYATYAINKTLKVKKHKAYFLIKAQMDSRTDERDWCSAPADVYYYIKPKR